MIDAKDLRLITDVNEIPVDGWFYRKEDDGFHTCQITQADLVHRFAETKWATMGFIKDQRLYTRISKPWHNFR